MDEKISSALFTLILAALLVTASFVSSTGTKLVFGQGQEPKNTGESSNPKANEKLPSNSLYNQMAEKMINETSKPQNVTLPSSNSTDTGLESKHKDNWITTNHDIYYTRSSNQTVIGKDNVNKLQVKWIFNDENYIENPPLIVDDKVYALDNGGRVLALNAGTGLNLWKVETGGEGTLHGMTYDNGVIFVPTGEKSTVMAIAAEDGRVLWESKKLAPEEIGYHVVNPPIVWKDYVIAGSAGGDLPTHKGIVQGNVTALNRTNGEILWNLRTTIGDWVSLDKVPPNGGGTTWSGGSYDPETGILYIPVGNATPDFNATTRAEPNKYTNHMLAIDITTGTIKWATPFIEQGTVLKDVSLPDTHDFDISWGSTLSKFTLDNGTGVKLVIGTDKRGDIMAMDAEDGKPVWSNVLGTVYNDDSIPKVNGSGEVWPGTQYGVEDYHAVDNDTAYFATSSMGFNYFLNETNPIQGRLIPTINSIANGIGNGTITAIDIANGSIKWNYTIDFPTWASPLVTNGVVFSGHVTPMGKPYTANVFGAPIHTPIEPSGIVIALDKDTGKLLWEFNVGSPVGIGGPSIGHGLLLVPTGVPAETLAQKGGSIVAFGLPQGENRSAAIPINVTQGVLAGADKVPTTTPEAGQQQNSTATAVTTSAASGNNTSNESIMNNNPQQQQNNGGSNTVASMKNNSTASDEGGSGGQLEVIFGGGG